MESQRCRCRRLESKCEGIFLRCGFNSMHVHLTNINIECWAKESVRLEVISSVLAQLTLGQFEN